MAYPTSAAALQSWLEAGLQAHRQGDIDQALSAYRQVLAVAPDHPPALRLLGTGLLQLGYADEAVDYLERAARRQSADPELLANLAQAYLALKRYSDAAAFFRKASRLAPNAVQLQVGVAAALAMDGKLADAKALLARQAKRFPKAPLVWFNLGNVLRDLRQPAPAIDAYRKALELDPQMVEARNSLGSVLQSTLRFREAEIEYRACIEADPDFILPYYNLASVTMDLGRFAEAEEVAREIVLRAPNVSEAYRLVGTALVHQARLLEALPWYAKSAEIAPDVTQAARGYGIALMETGHTSAGLRWLSHAGALAPDATEQSASGVLLAHGLLHQGWNAYQGRAAATEFRERHPQLQLAPALPANLHGRQVCVIAEQGLGDQLFFLRYTAPLAARGARVVHRADRKLQSLLARVGSLHEVVRHDGDFPSADYYVLAGDLPRALAQFPSSALAHGCYPTHASRAITDYPRHTAVFWPPLAPTLRIAPRADKRAEIRARLAALGPAPYVGITWRAGTAPEKQQTASWLLYKAIDPGALGTALRDIPGTILALQREPGAGEIDAVSDVLGRPVHDVTSLNDDLEGMLALLAVIDEYVGVSNTNMHLRAAAGRTARVLIPQPAEWRWMQSGRESPWFDGFSLYRQSLRGDWSAALGALSRDLHLINGQP